METKIIVAYSKKTRGIGNNNSLSWHLKGDMKYFKDKTINCTPRPENTVIMGRNTWESIPKKFRPLPNRINVVVSNSGKVNGEKDGCIVVSSLDKGIRYAQNRASSQCFIIGGAQLYTSAIHHPKVKSIIVTEIYKQYECDTFFPDFMKECNENPFVMTNVSRFQCEDDTYYRFIEYYRKNQLETDNRGKYVWENKVEKQALDCMRQIVEHGQERIDRTGIGTRSLFGMQWKYDLTDTFPIWTSKRIFIRAIFEELRLYMSGKTDNAILQKEKILKVIMQ